MEQALKNRILELQAARRGEKLDAIEAKMESLAEDCDKVLFAVLSQNIELKKSVDDALLRIDVLEHEVHQLELVLLVPPEEA